MLAAYILHPFNNSFQVTLCLQVFALEAYDNKIFKSIKLI